MDSWSGGEMNIGLDNDRQQRQERCVYGRMCLGINRLRIVDAVLLAEFRALLVHSLTRLGLDIGGRRYRTTAIRRRRTGMGGHRELQEQQRAQAKPCDVFPARSTHKTMITQSLVRVQSLSRLNFRQANGDQFRGLCRWTGGVRSARIAWFQDAGRGTPVMTSRQAARRSSFRTSCSHRGHYRK